MGLCTGFINRKRVLKDIQLFKAFKILSFFIILNTQQNSVAFQLKNPLFINFIFNINTNHIFND